MPRKSTDIMARVGIMVLVMTLSACSWFSDTTPEAEKPTEIYLQLGIRYMDLNKLKLAKENLLLALEKDPNNAKAHSALAFLYEKITHFDQARQHYEAALGLAPDDIGIQNNYGKFLCERRQFDRGLALLTTASSNLLNDRQWMALTNAARCHLGMGQRPEAIALLKRALNMNGQYSAALLEMQKISYQMGDYKAAEDYLQSYLSEANHTAETLWVGIQTEQALGNMSLANEYRTLLLDKFPNSNEAKQVAGIR
ncbi:type IV pilus biogenesis/stability protein PilW [Methyloglobulus morosus KoM1]|uniref:Type IV pilus biogenesis/stability protein PilW n=2 Tax=Methyloglobulus TaxID=1410680 RepID=V5C538_9GAMM|nr:type IV pilus biogenesis/stability protein PilW [Methyloglobulus morosus KoM1]